MGFPDGGGVVGQVGVAVVAVEFRHNSLKNGIILQQIVAFVSVRNTTQKIAADSIFRE